MTGEPGRAFPGAGAPRETPPSVGQVLRGSGRPLEPSAQAFFEERFETDFSRVRIHDDARAAASAEGLNAEAYTVAPHIVFGPSRYQPHGRDGRALLAHELTHVVQQGGSPASGRAAPGPLVQRAPAPSAKTSGTGTKPDESALPRPEDKVEWHWKDLLIYPLLVDLWRDVFKQGLTAAEKKEFKLAGTEGAAFWAWMPAGMFAGQATAGKDFGDFLKSWAEHAEEIHKFASKGDLYLDMLSRMFGLQLEKYLGSDLFLKRLKSHSASVVSVFVIAQTILSTVQAVKEPGAETGKFEPSQWEKQLDLVKKLAGIILKEQFKAPDFFDIGPLKLKTHPAFSFSSGVGGAVPSDLTFEHAKGVGEGEGGEKLKLGLTLNLPSLISKFGKGKTSAEDIADLQKYRGWQGSLWFSYDKLDPTTSMKAEGKLAQTNLRTGAVFGGAGFLGLLETGFRYSGNDGKALSAWFLRGGFGYSGTKNSVLKRIGFDVTYTDWKATDIYAPGREAGTPTAGNAAQFTPFTKLEFGTRHKFGVGAALSFVTGSSEDLGVSAFRGDLSYTYLGNRSKDALPVFKLDLSGSMHRLDWWNPNSPLLGGVEAKVGVNQFFGGAKVLTGAGGISESRAAQIGETAKVRVPTSVLFSAGVYF